MHIPSTTPSPLSPKNSVSLKPLAGLALAVAAFMLMSGVALAAGPAGPTPTPTPTFQGSFVIGDVNAVVGNRVTFWGAQWARANSLSSGQRPPNSFKGFANSTIPDPATCGGTWTSDPGNSSGPPSTIPAFITAIA